jgi:hypothetical protein
MSSVELGRCRDGRQRRPCKSDVEVIEVVCIGVPDP